MAMTESRQTGKESTTAAWLGVARWASWTILAWSVLLQLLASQIIPPVLVIGVVFGVLGFVLVGDRKWLGLIAAVLAVVALGGNLPGTIDELSNPSSAPAFVLTLLVVLAAVVLVVSGLGAFRSWQTGLARPLVLGSAAVMVGGIALAVFAASSVDSASAQAGDVRVVAVGIEFEPTEIQVEAGTTGFWVDNQDGARHTFTIRETGQEIDIPAFSAQRADLDLEPGTYQVFCAVPGHENMEITLEVGG